MPEISMPRLSDSMEEGTILKWLKSQGDEVARGEDLVVIETDKAAMTYESDQDGTLTILAEEGATVPVGVAIARLGGEDGGPAAPEPTAADARAAAPSASGRVRASPTARRLAQRLGLDLDAIQGSGPAGRIVVADVEALAPAEPAEPAPEPARRARESEPPAPPEPPAAADDGASGRGQTTVRELSRLQQTIARRMAESKATAPEFVVSLEVDMAAAVEFRAALKAAVPDAPAPSLNDFVVKASALALRDFPRANAAYRDGRFELYSRVNVGIAVAAQDALIVPTIMDADRKSLGEIALAARALAERVRAGQVTPAELAAGTFSVSNLGMWGIQRFTAVLNPPQAAILAVGEMTPRPVVRDGEVVVRPIMELTLTCDHRILYGADAAQFLARIRERLERPLSLAL
jgi:pyruvate dehydrogenase E2 component (dihydrolipoamide acetyltransferase)